MKTKRLLVALFLAAVLGTATGASAFVQLRGAAVNNVIVTTSVTCKVGTVVQGDLQTCTLFSSSAGTTYTPPAGWTAVAHDATTFSLWVYTRIAPVSPADAVFTSTTSGQGEGVSWGEFDDGGNTLSVDSTGTGSSSATTYTITTTGTTAQNWEAFHYTIRQGQSARIPVPTGMTTVDEGLVRTSTTTPTSVGFLIYPVAGTAPSQVVTSTGSAGNAPWVGWTIKGASTPTRDYRIRNISTCSVVTSTTMTCNKPTGTVDTDLVVIAAACTDTPAATFGLPTGGPTWAAIAGSSDSTRFPIKAWQHAAASDPSTYSVTTSVNCRINGTVWTLFSGTATLTVKGASTANSTGLTNYNLPTLAPAATDDILLFNLQGTIGNAGVWNPYGYINEANAQFSTYMMSAALQLTASTASQGPASVSQFSGTTQDTESVLIDVGTGSSGAPGWFF